MRDNEEMRRQEIAMQKRRDDMTLEFIQEANVASVYPKLI